MASLSLPLVSSTPAGAVTNPVTVTMSATPNPVAVGGSLTYTIVATTTQPQQTNVQMSDQLNGLTNVVLTSSRGYCNLSSNLVSCSAGSIPGQGETWTVTVTGQVTAGSGTALSNTATVTGNWSPQNTSQAFSVAASTNVAVQNQPTSGLADLQVAIVGPGTASPGANATFTLTVSNNGGANATGIQVTASLPAGFGIQSGQNVAGTSLFNCVTTLPNIVCTGGAVNAGANATITIPAVVSSTTPGPNGLSYTTTAVVDPENAIPESNELNNTFQQTLTVPAGSPPPGQVTFTKTASSPVDPTGAQVRPNDTLTYTITAKDTGTGSNSVTRVQITDATQGLDQSAVSVKSSDPKLICKNSNALVTCAASNNNFTLGAGASVTVTVSGRVVQPPSSIITNSATLQGLQNKLSVTRTATFSTIVRPPVDLTVTQYATCTPAPPAPGALSLLRCGPFRARNQFDYLITVGNSGLNDAGGTSTPSVTVREPLPPDVLFEGYANLSPSGGFYCAVDTSNVVTCTGGTVPGALSSGSYSGTTRQIRLHLTAPDSIGPITATVTVDPYNTIPESDETNNTATTTTPIATGIDLTITQSVRCPRDTRATTQLMCDPVAPSGTLMYDILVQNVGTQDATGIKVSDILPVGTRFRSAKEVPPVFGPGTPYTPAHGLSCTSTNGSEVDCTGGELLGIYKSYGGGPPVQPPGLPDSFTVEVTAFAPAPYGPNSSPSATGSPILNQVQVDPDNTIPEILETNNLNILETNVGIPPLGDWGTYNELTVSDAQTNPPSGAVAPNGTLAYTLTVSNWGSDPVSNVTVNDYVPTGSRFRDVTVAPLSNGTGGFSCSFNNQNAAVVTCTNGALAASPGVGLATSTTIVILLFAPPTPNATTNQYTNHAVVDPSNTVAEADETNNASDVALTVALPSAGGQNAYNEFTVDNVQTNPASGTAVAPYGTLEYTLTAHNSGSDPAFGVTVNDYLPQGAQFRDVTVEPLTAGSGGFLCNYSSGVVSCNNGSIAAGATAWIKVLLFAPGTPNNVTSQYTNHAVINPANTVPEADVTNDATDASLTVSYPAPDGTGVNQYNEFSIASSQSFPTSSGAVAPGGTLLYQLTIPNTGSDPAVNVPVRDYLPTGTTFRLAWLDTTASSTGVSGFVCTQNTGVLDCVNGTIPAGGQAVIDILLFAPNQPTSPGSQSSYNVINQAIVNPGQVVQEADPTNDTSTTTSTVSLGGAGSYWDLTSSLTGSDTTGQPDQPIHYTLTVTNRGTDDLFNATVADTLPAGTTFVSAGDHSPGAGQFTCSVNGQVITCTGGTIQGTASNSGNPGTREIDIVANAPHANGAVVDQATADPNNAVPEADETNNSSSVSTNVQSVIDLGVTLDSASIGQGNEGDITGHITNTGSADAQNVQTVWNLPISVTVLDVNPPAGTSCSNTQNPVNQFVCTTPTLSAGATLNFTFHVYDNSSNTLNDNATINADNKTVESDASNDTNDVANSTVS